MDVRGASCRSGWMTTSSRERPTQKTAGPDGAPPQRRRLNLSIQERLRRLRLDRDARRPTATEVRLRKSRQAVHEKWLALTAASRRGPVAPTHPRLSEYLERWLNESVRPNLAPQTVANYEFFSRAYIGPDLGRNGSTGFGTRRPAVDGSSCPLSVLRSRQGCTPT